MRIVRGELTRACRLGREGMRASSRALDSAAAWARSSSSSSAAEDLGESPSTCVKE